MRLGTYAIEFQERRLSHAYILVWLRGDKKQRTYRNIDKIISTKFLIEGCIPTKLFKTFTTSMIRKHRGEINQISYCKKDGKISKYYPSDIN